MTLGLLYALVASVLAQSGDKIRLSAMVEDDTITVRVRVNGQWETGVEGATVEIWDRSKKELIASDTTKTSGVAVFKGIKPPNFRDYYVVTASKGILKADEEAEIRWEVPENHTVTLGTRKSQPAAPTLGASAGPCCETLCCDVCSICDLLCFDFPVCTDDCLPPTCDCGCPPVPCPCPCLGAFSTSSHDGVARLTVSVPEGATVFINGHRTTKTGRVREYVSLDLTPGNTYTYTIRAETVRDGKVIADTREVTLRLGDNQSVAFDFADKDDRQLATAR